MAIKRTLTVTRVNRFDNGRGSQDEEVRFAEGGALSPLRLTGDEVGSIAEGGTVTVTFTFNEPEPAATAPAATPAAPVPPEAATGTGSLRRK